MMTQGRAKFSVWTYRRWRWNEAEQRSTRASTTMLAANASASRVTCPAPVSSGVAAPVPPPPSPSPSLSTSIPQPPRQPPPSRSRVSPSGPHLHRVTPHQRRQDPPPGLCRGLCYRLAYLPRSSLAARRALAPPLADRWGATRK